MADTLFEALVMAVEDGSVLPIPVFLGEALFSNRRVIIEPSSAWEAELKGLPEAIRSLGTNPIAYGYCYVRDSGHVWRVPLASITTWTLAPGSDGGLFR